MIKIDWGWVKTQLSRTEKIPLSAKSGFGKRALCETAEACLAKAGPLSAPRGAFAVKNITAVRGDSIGIEGGVRLYSKFVSSYLDGAKFLHFFLVSIGSGIEKEATRLMDREEGLEGYLLDRIGSLAVESLAESFEKDLRRQYGSKPLSVSSRLSPGYCDWPIEEQFKLAKIIDFSEAGVRLTKSCVMVPKKSISAVVGVGPEGLFSKAKSQCAVCDKPECSYRRKM